jgi:hypothetical protein
MDGGEAIPEFVRDAGRELPDRRKALPEAELLFELLDRGEVGEETDRALQAAGAVRQRRHGHAEMGGAPARLRHVDHLSKNGRAGGEAVVDQRRERRFPEQPPVVVERHSVGYRQHPARRGIENPDAALQSSDEQSCGQARDDLIAQMLRGLGAGRRRPLLRLQAAHGIFQRGGQHRRLRAAAPDALA